MEAIIHIEDKQTNRILDYIPEENYWNEIRTRKLSNNLDTFDFETFADKPFSEFINDQNRIVIPDKQFGYAEFVIDDFEQTIDNKISVYTTGSFLLLKKSKPINPFKSSTNAAKWHITDALKNNDEWKVGKIAHTTLRSFEFEEHTNTYDLLKKIASAFNLELQFRIVIENGEVVRYVDMVDKIGKWRGYEIAYGHNMTGITRKSKSSHIVTALMGISPADQDGKRKTVLVTNEDARKRWGYVGKDGQKQHYYAVYYPESTDQDMTKERLTTLTENELEKRISAKFEYAVDFEILSHEIYFGDEIRVRNEDFNPPLYLDARVHTLEEGLKKSSRPKATLGDYVEFTQAEATALFKLLQKQVAIKIDGAKLREYTYNKVMIDDKDTVVFEEGKSFAELQAANALKAAKADATTKANEAQAAAEAVAIAKANLAQTNAEAHADGIVSAEEQARIDADTATLNSAKADAKAKADAAEKAAEAYTRSQLTNYVSTTLYDEDLQAIQAQIDNQITSHFKDYEPSLSNLPASEWVDNAEKDKHIGDLFYNSSTGYSYRFMVDNGIYKWVLVRDEGIAKALQDAAEAQDTADSKRRVFVAQPTTPYDKGDLWDRNGAIYRSTVDKTTSATFSVADWYLIGDVTNENTAKDTDFVGGRPADKITDEGFVNGAIGDINIGGRNYVLGNPTSDSFTVSDKLIDEVNKGVVPLTLSCDVDFTNVQSSNSRIGFEISIYDINGTRHVIHCYYYPELGETNSLRVKKTLSISYKADYLSNTYISNTVEGGTVSNVKIEKGNKATDWTPAPEDQKAYTDKQANQAEQNAKAYAVAKEIYDAKVTELTQNIADKAGLDYVDGKLVDKANKNDVYTIEDVDSRLLNYVGVTKYETDQNGIVQTLDSHSTRLGQNETAIGLKADSSVVDALTGTIEDHSAEFNVMAGEIRSKVDATYVSGAIADVEIGGRNYVLNSDKPFVQSGNFFLSDNFIPNINLDNSTDISMSCDIEVENATGIEGNEDYRRIGFEFSLYEANGTRHILHCMYFPEPGETSKKRISKTFNIDFAPDTSGQRAVYIQVAGGKVVNIKIEKGNKATDWTPAPEDQQSQIDANNQTITEHSTSITQLSTEIESKVESSVVNALTGRVEANETTITQHDTRINAKAESSTVDALGNRISTAELDIDGLNSTISLKADATIVNGVVDRVSSAEITIDGLESEIILKADKVDLDAYVTINDLEVDGNLKFGGTLEGASGTFNGSITSNTRVIPYTYEVEINNGHLRSTTREDSYGLYRKMDLYAGYITFTGYAPGQEGKEVMFDVTGITLDNGGAVTEYLDAIALQHPNGSNARFWPDGTFTTEANGQVYYSFAPDALINEIGIYKGSRSSSAQLEIGDNIVSERIYTNTYGSAGGSVVVTDQGTLGRRTSASKYKLIAEPMQTDKSILGLQPKDWYDKGNSEHYGELLTKEYEGELVDWDTEEVMPIERIPGLVAEDLAAVGLSKYVQYGNGEVEGIDYERAWIELIPIIKEQQAEINELKGLIK